MTVLTTFDAFRRAVESLGADSVDVAFDPDAELLADQALTESKTLLLGECHGVAENPAMVRALVDRLDVDMVALEWPAELAEVVDRYARHGELADDELLWLGDGRVSAEHLVALAALVRDGVKIAPFDRAFAPARRSWSERDRALADAALALTAGGDRTLVVAGNAHTPLADTAHGTPMGAWIASARPGTREIVIQYGSGTFFNFGEHTFPERFAGEPAARLCLIDGGLQLRLARASTATVAYRRGSAVETTG